MDKKSEGYPFFFTYFYDMILGAKGHAIHAGMKFYDDVTHINMKK